jgi:hypothetical protein
MHTRPMTRPLVVLGAAITLAAAHSSAAWGAALSFQTVTPGSVVKFTLEDATPGGEANQVALAWQGGDRPLVIQDLVPITVNWAQGPPCEQPSPTTVVCGTAGAPAIQLDVRLGLGNDRFFATYLAPDGGRSIQTLSVQGGPGADTLVGSPGNEELYGGSGVDTLFALTGEDTLNGGDQNDTIVTFDGAGDDKAYCDDLAADGIFGDRDVAYVDPTDNVHPSCEQVVPQPLQAEEPPAWAFRPPPPAAPVPPSGGVETVFPGASTSGPAPRAPWARVTGTPRLSSDRRRVPVRITCPKSASGTCTGTAKLQTARKVRLPGHRRAKVLTLATGRFRAAQGKTTTVTLRLGSTGRRLLKGKRSYPVKLTLAGKDGTDARRTAAKTFNLKVAGGPSAR